VPELEPIAAAAAAPADPDGPAPPSEAAAGSAPLFRPLDGPPWRARLDGLIGSVERFGVRPRTAVVAAGALALAVLLLVVLGRTLWAAPSPALSLPMAPGAGSGGAGSTPAAGAVTVPVTPTAREADVVVAAAGAVARPGLYELPAGSRVADLVAAAGGMTADADADRVNVAALLVDGQQIYIPRVGESPPASVAGGTGGDAGGAGGNPGGSPTSDHPLDLNRAGLAELDTLPGVGPATAQAIVDYREAHGGFRSVDELLEVRGIGDAKLAELRPLVRV
jgi:competence protein ComEA